MNIRAGVGLAVTLAVAACGGGGGKDAGTGPYGTTPTSGTPGSGSPPASSDTGRATAGGGGGTPAGPGPSGPPPTSGTPGSGSPPASSNTVTATSGSTFSPSTLTVARGATVTFVFENVTHNVTFSNSSGAPSNIGDSNGTSVQRQFNTAGTFGFSCTIHGSYMTGQVTVQ